jgi:hypothetical protein
MFLKIFVQLKNKRCESQTKLVPFEVAKRKRKTANRWWGLKRSHML